MSHKKTRKNQNSNLNKGYNQNQQASAEDELMSEKYKNNSNAQE